MGIALALAFFSTLLFCILTSSIRLRRSTLSSSLTLFLVRLKWAIDFLLCHCLFPNFNYVLNHIPEVGYGGGVAGGCHWKTVAATSEAGECSVCQFKVEEGDEIGDLRCGHVYHSLCLETWVRYGRFTCPICRDSLAPPPRLDSDEVLVGQEVRVLVEFYSCSSRDRERWWLR